MIDVHVHFGRLLFVCIISDSLSNGLSFTSSFCTQQEPSDVSFLWDENYLEYYILSSRKKIHCEICTYFTKEGPISMIHLNSKVIFKVLNYFYCSLSFLNEECIATGNNIESTFCIFMVNIWSFLWVHCWHWYNREFDRTFPFLRETWKMITIVLHYIQYLPFSFLHFPTQLVLNSPIILSPVF